jgi:hypothetical protein
MDGSLENNCKGVSTFEKNSPSQTKKYIVFRNSAMYVSGRVYFQI